MLAPISIVIVNWNAGPLLLECVRSLLDLRHADALPLQIIVVDNASSDGSIDCLQDFSSVTAIINAENRGFAAACNQGAAMAVGDELLFLNPDCRVGSGSIEVCAKLLRSNASVGVVSVALYGDEGRISRSCHSFPNLGHFLIQIIGLNRLSKHIPDGSMRNWQHADDRIVDHVIGAFYMTRRSEFISLGGFDERFFVYLEDLDLSFRYHQAGWRCMFLAAPAAYHKGGGTSENAKAARLFFSTRSRILYAFKHFSLSAAWIHLLATLLVEPVTRVVERSARGRFGELREITRGFRLLYRDLPSIIRTANRR